MRPIQRTRFGFFAILRVIGLEELSRNCLAVRIVRRASPVLKLAWVFIILLVWIVVIVDVASESKKLFIYAECNNF